LGNSAISSKQKLFQNILMGLIAIISILPFAFSPANAARGDRTLYLYYTHTKETAKITFRSGNRYNQKGLNRLNVFLRDWRRNESIKMDPALFDLVWEVYQQSGATGPIHVVSAYRSPKTNEMLRSRSGAVAKGSRHTKGQALDFFIPGVRISKLRQIAMKKQVGGVGYYPASNSPFVHLDTGNVRAWPRMTRAQLQKLFPNGKTLHVPNTGVPISNKGYQLARAEWTRCRAVPCSSKNTVRATTQVASNSSSNNNSANTGSKKTLFDLFFNNEENKKTKNNNVVIAARTPTQPAPPKPKIAPIPQQRPAYNITQIAELAPIPSQRPNGIVKSQTPQIDNVVVAAIDENITPSPRILLSRLNIQLDDRDVISQISAYAPVNEPIPLTRQEADKNSNLIAINNLRSAALNPSLSINNASEIFNDKSKSDNLIDSSWSAVLAAEAAKPIVANKLELLSGKERKIKLVAPDLDHVIEIFTDPQSLSSNRYAILSEPDEADLNPASELGSHREKLKFIRNAQGKLKTNKFTPSSPLIVAMRKN